MPRSFDQFVAIAYASLLASSSSFVRSTSLWFSQRYTALASVAACSAIEYQSSSSGSVPIEQHSPFPAQYAPPRSTRLGAETTRCCGGCRERPQFAFAARSNHAERVQICFKNRFLLGALVFILLTQSHDRAQHLHIVAVALGFRVNVADVVGNRLLLFLEALYTFDKSLELIFGKLMRVVFSGNSGSRSGSRHVILLHEWRRHWLAARSGASGLTSSDASNHPQRRPAA